MKEQTKKMVMTAMLVAIAFLMTVVIHITVFNFLTYEPKDVVITIGGFLFGPLTSCIISVVTALIEFLTISKTGPWGLLMNILASVSFCVPAAFIYKKKHTMQGAILGLGSGVVLMTVMMLLWNYFVTPIYMGVPREQVAGMLTTVFLPFNLIKAVLNAGWTLLLYKPVVTGLRKAGVLPESTGQNSGKPGFHIGMMLAAGVIVVTCVVWFLVQGGII